MDAGSSKVLEVDFTGANLNIVMDGSYADQYLVKTLFGVDSIASPGDYRPNSLQSMMKRHFDQSRNFVILNGCPVVDSQSEDVMQKRSIIFNYSPSMANQDDIFLNVAKVDPTLIDYRNPPVVSYKDLPGIVKERSLQFSQIPSSIYMIDLLEGFKPSKKPIEPLSLQQVVKDAPPTENNSIKELRKLEERLDEDLGGLQPPQRSSRKIENPFNPEEKWLRLEGLNVKRAVDVHGNVFPPDMEIIALKDYDLHHIERDFELAAFERKVSYDHVADILEAILNNKFYDNIIRVAKLQNGKYGLMDAQHRMHAFVVAREKYGLQRYNFLLLVHPEEQARSIYRKINLGKVLSLRDHTKAIDDGNVKFFNELREWLSHYPRDREIGFVEMANAWLYAKKFIARPEARDTEKSFKQITEADTERMKIFLKATCNVLGSNKKGVPSYRAAVFRNIFRLFEEKHLDQDQLTRLIEVVQNDDRIVDRSMETNIGAFRSIYTYVQDDLLQKILTPTK